MRQHDYLFCQVSHQDKKLHGHWKWRVGNGSPIIVVAVVMILSACNRKTEEGDSQLGLLEAREELDKTVWADEVRAQEYEKVFTKLWDQIRRESGREKLAPLLEFPFETLQMPTASSVKNLELGVSLRNYSSAEQRDLSATDWRQMVTGWANAGYEILQTEWHHNRFDPDSGGAPRSAIGFVLHIKQPTKHTRIVVEGELDVQWKAGMDSLPKAKTIGIISLRILRRTSGGGFQQVLTIEPENRQASSSLPMLVYDLDKDGRSDIVFPSWNRIYWNRAGAADQGFVIDGFVTHAVWLKEAAIISDFDGDANADFVAVSKEGQLIFFKGATDGKFPTESIVCADVTIENPTAITTGDIDGDGDLDLWVTQYRASMIDGQIPSPYYDANDGYPSFLLLNDGGGRFTDATVETGLAELRHRRTFSASFIDLDEDGDLDLLNVSDFAGVDIHENQGDGRFTLATDKFIPSRHFFGMGHTFGDYDRDGRLDFYVIGMSSTTARRLDDLDLGRADHPDIHRMRAEMGYGNRMYFGSGGGRFVEKPDVAASVARTGWSWGTTSFDMDLDGDEDIYVANGHRSGKSCQDYCTQFWRHDLYASGSGAPPAEIKKLFSTVMTDLNGGEISWNGFEKNFLFLNDSSRSGRFTNIAHLVDSAFAFDARSVVSDDFDGDGRPDLLVSQSHFAGNGFVSKMFVYQNEIESAGNHWIGVRLYESGPGFSPNGAKVTLKTGRGIQTSWLVTGDSYMAQHAPVAHFGLGVETAVEYVEVRWPNGIVQKLDKPRVDSWHRIEADPTRSSP
jgi:hypothetical protein